MFYLIRENNCDELGDASQNLISMQCLFILSVTACKAKIFFDVINLFFNNSPGFVGAIPFFRALDGSGICSIVTGLLNIDHSSTG